MSEKLEDVQSAEDERRIAIDKVGIKGIRHPRVRARQERGRAAYGRRIQHVRRPAAALHIVESENFESIHNHSAYALIERDPPIAS